MRRLDELAEFSSEENALTRLYLSPEYKAAALQVMAWMSEAGMKTMIDAVGNVVGRYNPFCMSSLSPMPTWKSPEITVTVSSFG